MYISLSILLLSFLILIISRFTAKQQNKLTKTMSLNILLVLVSINLIFVGVSFILHKRYGKNNIINYINISNHVVVLIAMIIIYFINIKHISGLSSGLLLVSTILFISSIPMTLLYLFSTNQGISNIPLKEKEDINTLLKDPFKEEKINIEDVNDKLKSVNIKDANEKLDIYKVNDKQNLGSDQVETDVLKQHQPQTEKIRKIITPLENLEKYSTNQLIPDLQIEKKLNIEQVPVCNYNAMDLLQSMKEYATNMYEREY